MRALLRRLSPPVVSATSGRRMASYDGPLGSRDGISEAVERAEYAVRGALVLRANELRDELKSGKKHEFDDIVYCNIGNPHALHQKPLSFLRQVLAGTVCADVLPALPGDAARRARDILEDIPSVGAYSNSKGVPAVRARIAAAIQARDEGIVCDAEELYLTNGASDAVKLVLTMLVRKPSDGVLVPIPQYPLYSATMELLCGTQVDYYLDEEDGWALDMEALARALESARGEGTEVRAIVVINPGNPTGQTLARGNMEELVRFCERENLAILADEVYQKNVYNEEKPFVSFKRVVCEMKSPVELASFHSVSKGVIGECGLRGGYLEAHNFSKHAQDMVYKLMSVSLCANLPGQIAVDIMMSPPQPGDESYERYKSETREIYESLKHRATIMSDVLNKFEGVTCNASEGAMYLFPKISLPKKAIEEAERQGYKHADEFYCMELLEHTGICVVPGSGFGQKPGTLHFRTTFLPPVQVIERHVSKRMADFHNSFLTRFT